MTDLAQDVASWLKRYSGQSISPAVQNLLDTESAKAKFVIDTGARTDVPTEFIEHLVSMAPQGHGGVTEALHRAYRESFSESYFDGDPFYRAIGNTAWGTAVANAIASHGGHVEGAARGLFVDVSTVELRDGVRSPDIGLRSDESALLYSAAVNYIYGPPESGKTHMATAIAIQTLKTGGTVLWIDVDHNGAQATLSRLVQFGADLDTLKDTDRFGLAEPQDRDSIEKIVDYVQYTNPTLVVVDSLGEILSMMGVKTDSEYAFTEANVATLAPMARAGSAVLVIDHVTKSDSDKNGFSAGSFRKKGAIDGVSLRVKLESTFIPGHGGSARLIISKDRPGGLRASCAATSSGKDQTAAVFTLGADSDNWSFDPGMPSAGTGLTVPRGMNVPGTGMNVPGDYDLLVALDPPPRSVQDVRTRLKWGQDRASRALRSYKASLVPGMNVPVSEDPGA